MYSIPGIESFLKLVCTSYAHDAWCRSFVTSVTMKQIHAKSRTGVPELRGPALVCLLLCIVYNCIASESGCRM